LTGTSSEQHMQEDLAIFDFQLEPAEIDALTALF
jgi:diketogulonate reductase-like aldo/keto reductase